MLTLLEATRQALALGNPHHGERGQFAGADVGAGAKLKRLPNAKAVESFRGPNLKTVPLPQADPDRASRAYRAADFRHGEVQDVPLNQILMTQKTVNPAIVQRYIDQPGAPPLLIKDGNDYITGDGHHRITAEWAKSAKTVKSQVYHADPAKMAQPTGYKSWLDTVAPGRSLHDLFDELFTAHLHDHQLGWCLTCKVPAYECGNPHHGEGGKFATEDAQGRPFGDLKKHGTVEDPAIHFIRLVKPPDFKPGVDFYQPQEERVAKGTLPPDGVHQVVIKNAHGHATFFPPHAESKWLTVEDVHVAQRYQRQGYAQDLYRRALTYAHSIGLKGVRSTFEDRVPDKPGQTDRLWAALKRKHEVSSDDKADYLTKLADCDQLIVDLGNPHHGHGGKFATEDETGGDEQRYYITQNKEGFVVHDKKYSELGDPYRRQFKTREKAEARASELEAKYGHKYGAGKATPAKAPAPGAPVAAVGEKVKMSDFHKTWEPLTGQSARGDVFGKITADEKLGGGMNATRLLTVGDKQVVFKPESGEQWTSSKRKGPIRYSVLKEDGTMAQREIVAAAVDEALGTGMVPKTGRLSTSQQSGSAQTFMTGASSYSKAGHDGSNPDDWYKLATLQLVIGNTDCHTMNVLVGKNGKLSAIDHGEAFPRNNSEFRLRMASEVPTNGKPAIRAALVKSLSSTDWSTIIAPLGKPARDAFYTRVQDVTAALKSNRLRELVDERNLRGKKKK